MPWNNLADVSRFINSKTDNRMTVMASDAVMLPVRPWMKKNTTADAVRADRTLNKKDVPKTAR